MSDEGTSDRSFYYASRLFLVLLLTAIPCLIGLQMIESAFYVDSMIRERAFLISGGCFLLGSLCLAFFKVSKEYIVLWISGFIVAGVVVLLSWIQYSVIIAMMFPIEALAISATIIAITTFLYLQYQTRNPSVAVPTKTGEVISLSRFPLKKKVLVGGVELVQVPEDHFSQSTDTLKYRPFLDLLRALSLADIPLALRLERIHSKTRVFFLTWAKEEQTLSDYIVRLEDNLGGNLIGMKFKRCPEFSGIKIDTQQIGVVSSLKGEPLSIQDEQQKQDALTTMATVLQQMSNGVVQISSTPQRTNKRKLRNLEDKYRAEIARSERVISTPKSSILSADVQESITKVDPDAQRKAVSLAKQIERFNTQHLCEVRVAAVCWDTNKAVAEERSKRLMTTLRGNLVPADKNRSIDLDTRSDITEMTQILRGEPIGQATLLSIDEAAIFFVVPMCDLGISVADHASFSSNPATLSPPRSLPIDSSKPSICIGKILDESGREIGEFRILIEDIPTHTGTFGDIGTGKSSTQIAITLELRKHGINTLTLLVSKNEDHIRMIRSDKNIRVLTLGDETMSPARFSLTSMTKGVHVNQIINSIKTLFVAAKPTDGIIKEYLEKVIELTFKRLGWDRVTNTRGIPILLQDFVETLPLIEQELQYSSRGNEDFRGALIGRFTSVSDSILRIIFGTTSGISIEELVSNSYIILMDKLSVDERSFFLFWLVNNLALHFEAKKKTDGPSDVGLKYYVVLEEAHRTLRRESRSQENEGHGAHQVALDTICVTMTESRSSGLGFGLVTPDASQLALVAVKMPLNVFVHKTNAIDDRQLLGRQINCNDDQISMIGSLETGVAVVRLASNAKPLLVRIDNPLERYPELTPNIPVTDDEIMKHMKPFISSRPESSFADKAPQIQERSLEYASSTLDMPGLSRLYGIFSLPQFKKVIEGLSELQQSSNSLLVAMIIRDIAASVSKNSEVLPLLHSHLIWTLWLAIRSWTSEFRGTVITNLCDLLSLKHDAHLVDSEVIHERIKTEMTFRDVSNSILQELKQNLTDAVRHATSEYKALRPKDSIQVEQSTPTDTESLKLIDAIVKTEDFASRYVTRVEQAADGDYNSLLRLVEAFSKKLVTPSQSLVEIQTLLLERARAIHKIPTDDILWEAITNSSRIGSTEQGSECAA